MDTIHTTHYTGDARRDSFDDKKEDHGAHVHVVPVLKETEQLDGNTFELAGIHSVDKRPTTSRSELWAYWLYCVPQ